jgi:hypothetical protein
LPQGSIICQKISPEKRVYNLEFFSLVVGYNSLHLILAIAVVRDLEIVLLDSTTTFSKVLLKTKIILLNLKGIWFSAVKLMFAASTRVFTAYVKYSVSETSCSTPFLFVLTFQIALQIPASTITQDFFPVIVTLVSDDCR